MLRQSSLEPEPLRHSHYKLCHAPIPHLDLGEHLDSGKAIGQ